MTQSSAGQKANLFIFGCPRSGTTLLAELVNCHRQAVVLIERHGILTSRKELNLASYEPACVRDFANLACEHEAVNTALLNRLGAQPILRYGGNWVRNARAKEWTMWVRRYLGWIVGGIVIGYLWWPARVHSYHKFWMPAIGAWVGVTLVRQIVLGVIKSVNAKSGKDSNPAQGVHA